MSGVAANQLPLLSHKLALENSLGSKATVECFLEVSIRKARGHQSVIKGTSH